MEIKGGYISLGWRSICIRFLSIIYYIYAVVFNNMTILTHKIYPPCLWHLSHHGQGIQEVFSTSILVRIGHVVR